jgi:ribosomal protein S3AE
VQLYAANAEELEGKTIRLDLTKALRGKNFDFRLIVKNENGQLIGVPKGLYLVSSYIIKIMRSGADYAEDSFEAECRDVIARVKPLLITRNRVSRPVLAALRRGAKEYLQSQLKVRTAKEIFSDIMANKLQRELSLKLRKIYPLALCEIRVFEVIGEKKAESPKAEAVKAEVKEETKEEQKEEKAEVKEKKTRAKKEEKKSEEKKE